MLAIGSGALLQYTDLNRQPRDWDYICTHDEAIEFVNQTKPKTVLPSRSGNTLICFYEGEVPTELMLAWPGTTNEEILNLPSKLKVRDVSCDWVDVATLNTLYLLKMSHRYLRHSPFFEKTRNDILLMRKLGATIEYPDLLKRREKETYTYKHPNLDQSKNAFFDPNVGIKYIYDHDTIHLAMAHDPHKPAYTKFKHDQADVKVSRTLWEALPDNIKLESVLEEAYVLALERSQIPYGDRVSPDKSFKLALQRLSSSISSGWWREWAWEHYDLALENYNREYVSVFKQAVLDGVVLPFKG